MYGFRPPRLSTVALYILYILYIYWRKMDSIQMQELLLWLRTLYFYNHFYYCKLKLHTMYRNSYIIAKSAKEIQSQPRWLHRSSIVLFHDTHRTVFTPQRRLTLSRTLLDSQILRPARSVRKWFAKVTFPFQDDPSNVGDNHYSFEQSTNKIGSTVVTCQLPVLTNSNQQLRLRKYFVAFRNVVSKRRLPVPLQNK